MAKRPEEIQFNQLEGFVRQIIGWREYMRGIYWLKCLNILPIILITKKSYLNGFGQAKQNECVKDANQSLDYGYAHHIQRLITGNFAPWLELILTKLNIYRCRMGANYKYRGMSQFDGGIVPRATSRQDDIIVVPVFKKRTG
jgi:deoxyribodipyrimidine photolyase-related protein